MWRPFLFSLTLLLLWGCNQNADEVRNGAILESSPRPKVDPTAKPLAEAVATQGGPEGTGTAKVPPFLKAYFMHMFVEALYGKPGNQHPNPSWESPLKDPVNDRVWCTDCHTDPSFNFSKVPKQRFPENDDLERDHNFMVGLMTKWVARLNSDEFKAKAKLKHPVTCLTCHATDPRD
jgi:hypothetical protein